MPLSIVLFENARTWWWKMSGCSSHELTCSSPRACVWHGCFALPALRGGARELWERLARVVDGRPSIGLDPCPGKGLLCVK